MPRQFCPGIFCFAFLLPLPSGQKKKRKEKRKKKRGARLLMIHTKARLFAPYLDLEFISSPAEPGKAAADNRLHVGKAPFQGETLQCQRTSTISQGEPRGARQEVDASSYTDFWTVVWPQSMGHHTVAVPVLTTRRPEPRLIPFS